MLDLTGANAQRLEPVKHQKAWTDYSRQRVREIGLHLFSTHHGPAAVAPVGDT